MSALKKLNKLARKHHVVSGALKLAGRKKASRNVRSLGYGRPRTVRRTYRRRRRTMTGGSLWGALKKVNRFARRNHLASKLAGSLGRKKTASALRSIGYGARRGRYARMSHSLRSPGFY